MGKSDNSKNGKAFKAGIWYTISSVTVKTITIITTPIFTRMMSTKDYGIANTFSSWYTLLMIFCSLNLTYSIGRAKLDFPGKLKEYVGSLRLLAALTTIGLSVVGLIFIVPLSDFMEMNPQLVIILMIYVLFAPGMTFTSSMFRYEYRYKENILMTAYVTLSTILVTFIMLAFFKQDRYYAKVLGSVIPTVLLSAYFWYRTIKENNVHINIEYWKYGLAISLPLILHSVSLNILSQSDRIMITKFCGADDTGIYSLAYSYAILINIVLNAVNEAWLPWFHDSFFAEEYDAIRQNVRPLIFLGSMLGIGCIAIAPEAMLILGPSEYKSGQWVVAPVTIGIICQFIYQQYVHIELHMKKTSYISAGTIIASVLNILLNFIFIPKYGFIAAAYTTMLCYFVLMFVHLFITKKILKVTLYNDLFMFVVIAVVAVIAIGFSLIYDTILLRYGLLVALCLVYLGMNKKYIIKYIKNKKKSKNNAQ